MQLCCESSKSLAALPSDDLDSDNKHAYSGKTTSLAYKYKLFPTSSLVKCLGTRLGTCRSPPVVNQSDINANGLQNAN
jgi:hypothetical protein